MVKSSQGGHNTLDLTADVAKYIKVSLDEIAALYGADFPPIPASTPGVVQHTASTGGGAGDNAPVLTVVTQGAPLTPDEYKLQLDEHHKTIAEFDRNKLDAFVNNRLALVVDTLETMPSLKRKLSSVPLMNEKRRKVFVHDEMCAKVHNVHQCKEQKRSIFTPLKQTMTPESLDPLMTMYEDFKSSDDNSASEDVLAVLMPGAPPNSLWHLNCTPAPRPRAASAPATLRRMAAD